MFRILRVLILLSILAGTFLLFDRNSEPIMIYFFKDNGYSIPGYLAFILFIMIGVVVGYVISLKSVFSTLFTTISIPIGSALVFKTAIFCG